MTATDTPSVTVATLIVATAARYEESELPTLVGSSWTELRSSLKAEKDAADNVPVEPPVAPARHRWG
ncbi:hypothetical protein MKOR_01870 [Mycolicibacillus koreensis]|nr:hypothetical protein MKOR_01870 [Mycolicibacillus koreensis]